MQNWVFSHNHNQLLIQNPSCRMGFFCTMGWYFTPEKQPFADKLSSPAGFLLP